MVQVDLHLLEAPIKAAIARQFDLHGRVEHWRAAGRGTLSLTNLLKADMGILLANDPGIAIVQAEPETFSWRDGSDGRRRRYTPEFLTVTCAGTKVFREVKPYALLLRDPEFSGRRARIELECAARGATFEIWTEREIREDQGDWPLLRVATAAESQLHRDAPENCAELMEIDVPAIAMHVAARLGLTHPKRAGNTLLARSHLTGILMAVLCDLIKDPQTGALIWWPSPRRVVAPRVPASSGP